MTFKNLLTLAAVLGMGASAQAEIINIQLLDMDVVYSGGTAALYDATGIAGGNGTPAESDKLEAANFELGGVQVAELMSDDLYGDLLVEDMPATLTKGFGSPNTMVGNAGGGFGFDFFSDDYKLSLGIGTIDAVVTDGVFLMSAQATVLSQDLPAGLQFGDLVEISYAATLPAVQAGASTAMVLASGVMTISGESIPEPTAAAMVALAGLGGLVRRR